MAEHNRNLKRREAWRVEHKRLARLFLRGVRLRTTCVECGSQPVDFHRKEHEEHPRWRVSALASHGNAIKRIQREIDLSRALCRRCHMAEDGRAARFAADRFGADRNKAKSHCPKGHAYDEVNTWRDKLGRRYCRTCDRDKHRAQRKYAEKPGRAA